MKIKIGETKKKKGLKNKFVFKITTMEGDADDYHSFKIILDKNEIKEVEKLIIFCKVLEKAYPNGKGGMDGFYELDFFEEWFSDDWYAYEGIVDSFESFSLFFYDENSVKKYVSYILSDKDLEKINKYPTLDWR